MGTDKKVIAGIALATIVIIVGGIFFVSGDTSSAVSSGEIVARNGLHWHPKLTIIINGKKQEIPPDIGIGAVHSQIHTHKDDAKEGVIHMEMSGLVTKDETKLGNFFKTWGKSFKKSNHKMLVNGKENKDFDNYLMKDNDKIAITYEENI